jgi:coniferyl-aldehyde dehydrogenase
MTISNEVSDVLSNMESIFSAQKDKFSQNKNPSYESRINNLDTLYTLIRDNKLELVEAISSDYGYRSHFDTLISDITSTLHVIEYIKKNLKKWMKPSKRKPGLLLQPSKVRVHYQPIGVIGIVVPWNFPIGLAITPLATALAAGNTAMLKMSEFTPSTNIVLKRLLQQGFAEDQVAIVQGEVEVSTHFSRLAFNHLMFTGSTAVGKLIMSAAANNLTPVTLELGGKSPTIIAPDFDIQDAAERIAFPKSINSGQACVSPDYVLVPRNKVDEFVQCYIRYFNQMHPDGLDSEFYTSIVNTRQFERLVGLMDDAVAKGASIHKVREHSLDTDKHRLLPHLVTHLSEDMRVLKEEIFGPIVPIVPYDSIEDAIGYVNYRDRPLALYLMTHDFNIQNTIIRDTISGGVAINDALLQVAADDAPFGGNGPSGMGQYHGIEGFHTLSHAKTVLTRGRINFTKLIHPPYNTPLKQFLLKVLT